MSQSEDSSGTALPPSTLATVAIGSSAGGLEALEVLFASLPSESGMAFIIVRHPDASERRNCASLIERRTKLSVAELTDPRPLVRNQVYVLAPGAGLRIDDGRLVAEDCGDDRYVIDHSFRALARACGPRAIGVLLSGKGIDGTLGMRAIKEHGGHTIAQAVGSAAHGDMPKNAVATGMVDDVLPIESIAARLLELARELRSVIDGRDAEEILDRLDHICGVLRAHTSHDFSRYKRGTMVRRIERRIVAHNDSVASYLERLERDAEEVRHLFRELLIGVTAFFRDSETFDVLEDEIVPQLFEHKESNDAVRVWVPGCATGEEAYSLAMLLRDRARALDHMPEVQVFATDIDEEGLDVARQAQYPIDIVEKLDPSWRERYFMRDREAYRVTKDIREMCVFSSHDVLRDAPFSRLDLISCRNLLIYLEADIQRKLAPVFHYALRPGGFLVLGPSESIVTGELFRSIDKKHRIYRRLDVPLRAPLEFPLTKARRLAAPVRSITGSDVGNPSPETTSEIQKLLVDFVPQHALVHGSGAVIRFSEGMGRYLEPPAGAPSNDIVQMARKGLRLHLRTALMRACESQAEVVEHSVSVQTESETRRVDLFVRPLAAEDLFLIVFKDLGPVPLPPPGEIAAADQLVRQLESELKATRGHLQSTVEQLESSNEELKSTNEELISTNEELQSANEELQTSQEELQSVNEEVETVNSRLKWKLDELDRANSDLENLFHSTSVAIVFVDRKLHVRRFTPAALDVFRLIDRDIGRSITDIAARFPSDWLEAALEDVVLHLRVCERVVRLNDEARWFLARIHPYRTVDDVIDGAVLTLVEVTESRRAQEAMARLAAIVDSSQDAIIGKSLDGTISSWNAAAELMYGYRAAEVIGRSIAVIVPPERKRELMEILARLASGERVASFETVRCRKDGTRLDVSLTISPVRDPDGRIVGESTIARDITPRKRAEAEQRATEQRFRVMADAAPVGIWMADSAGSRTYVNRPWIEATGAAVNELLDHGWLDFVHPDDRQHCAQVYESAAIEPRPFQLEYRLRQRDGEYRWMLDHGVPLSESGQSATALIGSVVDIHDRKMAEERLRASEERARSASQAKDRFLAVLSHELRTPLTPVLAATQALEALGLENDARPILRTMRRNIELEARLIDDLLDMAKIMNGKLDLRRERARAHEFVTSAFEICREDFVSKNVELECAFEADRDLVWVDPARLQQVVWNLLKNAVKFTAEAGRVQVLTRTVNDTWEMRVRDTGVGIDPDDLPHIFTPFGQGRDVDQRFGGMGLGLAISEMLVSLHGGTLAAESDGAGRGATFTVTLPLAAEESARPPVSLEPATPATPSRTVSVLLVDDNRDTLEMMKWLLEHRGYRVGTADGVENACATAREFDFDVLVTDIGLPDGSGIDLLRRLSQSRSVAAVAVSGYGTDADVHRSREAGFLAHLVKPLSIETLAEAITSALG